MTSANDAHADVTHLLRAASRRTLRGISAIWTNPREFFSNPAKRSASCANLQPNSPMDQDGLIDDRQMSTDTTIVEPKRKISLNVSLRSKKRTSILSSSSTSSRTSRSTSSVIRIPVFDPLSPESSPLALHPDVIELETVVTITTIEYVGEDMNSTVLDEVIEESPLEEVHDTNEELML